MKTLATFLTVFALFVPASHALGGTKPLIRSSEETASALCRAYRRPAEEMVQLCEDALDEFRHTSREIAVFLVNHGKALDELGHPEEARAKYKSALELKPSHEPGWRNLGWSHWDDNSFPEAEAAFRKALDLKVSAEAMAGLGSVLRKVDAHSAEAKQLLEGAILISPDYNWTRVELGWFHYNRWENKEAMAYFKAALKRDQGYHQAAYGLARTLNRLRDFDGANVAISRAIEADAENATYFAQRSSILRNADRPKQALKDAMQAMSLDADLADGYVAGAWALTDLGRMPEALDLMFSGADQQFKTSYFHYNHADLLTRDERWSDALVAIDRALASADHDQHDFNLRAWILLVLERPAEAKLATNASLELAAENLTALFYRAFAEVNLGDVALALETFRLARMNGLNDADTDDFIALLIRKGHWAAAGMARMTAIETAKTAKSEESN